MASMVHPVLKKILKAQKNGDGSRHGSYPVALGQIRDHGQKSSCWIWWIWPTMTALRPRTSRPQFLLPDVGAVHEYLAHPILRGRLLEITEAACTHLEAGVPPCVLFGGSTDVEKFRESLTVFALVAASSHWDAVAAGGGRAAAEAADGDPVADLAAVARLSCRALAATAERTLCKRSVEVLTSAAGGCLDERWGATINPWELLRLSCCADAVAAAGEPPAVFAAGGAEPPSPTGKRRAEEISGMSVDEVEAQLAGVAALELGDDDLDLVLPKEGFDTLAGQPSGED